LNKDSEVAEDKWKFIKNELVAEGSGIGHLLAGKTLIATYLLLMPLACFAP